MCTCVCMCVCYPPVGTFLLSQMGLASSLPSIHAACGTSLYFVGFLYKCEHCAVPPCACVHVKDHLQDVVFPELSFVISLASEALLL